MSDLRKAAKMALRALDEFYENDQCNYEIRKQETYMVDNAIQSLIKALYEPEPEPEPAPIGYLWPTGRWPEFRFTQQERDGVEGVPVYFKPLKRKWVGLTDDDYVVNKFYTNEFLDGAEWAEAKLKEKNT